MEALIGGLLYPISWLGSLAFQHSILKIMINANNKKLTEFAHPGIMTFLRKSELGVECAEFATIIRYCKTSLLGFYLHKIQDTVSCLCGRDIKSLVKWSQRATLKLLCVLFPPESYALLLSCVPGITEPLESMCPGFFFLGESLSAVQTQFWGTSCSWH